MKTASSEALEEATLNARPERTARIAEGVTFSSDLQVFQAVGRTAAFWRRASRIYFGYKSAQAQAAFLGYPGQTAKDKFWQRHHAWAGAEMYSLAVDLRGFYLKVGQFLGARGDFVPMPICQQLSLLHDQVPPMTPEKTKEVIEQRLGKPIDAVFAWIDLGAPLGSASIAQVHKAKLKYSGTIVAVKVQYPDSLNVMLQDLANVRVAVAFLSKTELKFDLVSAVDELAAQIKLEFDFEREARVMDSIAEHLKVMKSAVAVPQSIPGLVTKDILVMTFLEGEQISRLKDHTAGLSVFERTQAAQLILSRICEAYGRMLLLQGLFQADCHPGNILVMKGGRIAILDYGQSKQLPPRDRLALANLVVALVDKDTLRISQTMDKLGVKTSTADPAVRAKMGYAMFDTRLKVDPFAADSPLKQTSVDDFPPDLFFVLRVVQLIRGLAVSMGVEDFSSASQWKPFAQEALQLRQKELKRSNWRKAYSADTWFSEGGIMPGGRSGKDASWYRSLRKPAWGLPTYLFRPVWCVLYILMAMSATLIYNQPEPITGTVKKQVPLFLFSLQLASNLAWNLCFFKLRNPSLALKCASLFLGLLCTTTITFHWILPSSAVLLLPALGWAVLLFAWNHSVWRNNRVGTPNATLRTLVQKVQQRQADMGGTMIDEEDMAWGEQARIAVEHEANMSQGGSSSMTVTCKMGPVNLTIGFKAVTAEVSSFRKLAPVDGRSLASAELLVEMEAIAASAVHASGLLVPVTLAAICAAAISFLAISAWQSKLIHATGFKGDSTKDIKSLPLPPGPWVLPYAGDTLRLIYQGLIKLSTDRQAIYGPIHRTWILGERNVFVADAACVRKILNGEHTIAEEDWPLGVCMLLGYKSVAVLTFDDHLNMRKLMSPAFNPKHLARGIPRLVELAEEHCREWAQKGDVMGAKAIKAFTFHAAVELVLGFEKSWNPPHNPPRPSYPPPTYTPDPHNVYPTTHRPLYPHHPPPPPPPTPTAATPIFPQNINHLPPTTNPFLPPPPTHPPTHTPPHKT
ncbi:hypothetical protein WJX77_004264 [Trebouxia sp. C0004]